MSFPRYPEYKASGVEWLGDVPEHWKVTKLGYESWVRARLGWKGLKAEEYVESGYIFLATPNIKSQDIDFTNVNYINKQRYDESPEIKLALGDVLLTKDGSTLGTVNVIRTLPLPATVNSSIAVITPKKNLESLFLYYLFGTSYMENLIQEIKGGMGVPHLFQADIVKFIVPMPLFKEQRIIADFLDRETAKIDGLIEEQRRLVELLKEKRQAVISHAVTKGLNPNAPMKPSGIEWLGDIPEHWEVFRMASLYQDTKEAGDDSLPVLSVSIHNGVSDREFDENELERKVARSEDKSKYVKVIPNDLVYNMMRAWQGGFGTVKVSGMVSPAYVVARPRLKIQTQFVEFMLRTAPAIEEMRRFSQGVTDFRLRLYWDKFKSMYIALPSAIEQLRICTYIENVIGIYEQLSAEAEKSITLLQERRTALISAAVTGKIDVRGLIHSESKS
ncbi:MAG: restriction endonuclease subunit S [Betaproteobacteria bacterium]